MDYTKDLRYILMFSRDECIIVCMSVKINSFLTLFKQEILDIHINPHYHIIPQKKQKVQGLPHAISKFNILQLTLNNILTIVVKHALITVF